MEKQKKNLEAIAREDGRFNPAAIRFVYEGLGFTAKKVADEPRHVTGQMLCETWGVNSTRDLGEIVYLMIRHNWMSAQPTDTIEDFDNVFDFQTVFKEQFEF